MENPPPPSPGMVISLRTRRDVVVADAERFLAAARQAYRELNEASEAEAAEAVTDVADAIFALLERDPALAVDEAVHGLSPAGEETEMRVEEVSLRGMGCFRER